MIDRTLDTKRKKHIAGGILLSMSFLLGGLAITVLTLQEDEEKEEEEENDYESSYLE